MKTTEEAREFVAAVHRKGYLPALAENVNEICRLTRNNAASAQELSTVVMRDAGLTSSLLATANSAFYRPINPVKTVTGAVVLLGFEKVRALALGLSIFQKTLRSLRNRALGRLYACSYFSGLFARELSRLAGFEEESATDPEEFFVGGLLYQLPFIALANAYPQRFEKMEKKMAEHDDRDHKGACKEVFGLRYEDICIALTEEYELPENIQTTLKTPEGEKPEQETALIVEANRLANMIFSAEPVGKNALKKVERELRDRLNDSSFSIEKFITKTCDADLNIAKFFNLDGDDIEMMVKVLEWGKASPSQLTSKLTFGGVEGADSGEEDPETLIGHFLTELMLEVRREEDLNNILMLAQEALYRCLRPAHVFAVFKDVSKQRLQGRFYTGDNSVVHAKDLTLALNNEHTLLMRSLQQKVSGEWHRNSDSGELGIPALLLNRLELKHAILSPLVAANRVIGLYFVGRTEAAPFEEYEKIWLDQITEHVGAAFSRRGKDEADHSVSC